MSFFDSILDLVAPSSSPSSGSKEIGEIAALLQKKGKGQEMNTACFIENEKVRKLFEEKGFTLLSLSLLRTTTLVSPQAVFMRTDSIGILIEYDAPLPSYGEMGYDSLLILMNTLQQAFTQKAREKGENTIYKVSPKGNQIRIEEEKGQWVRI